MKQVFLFLLLCLAMRTYGQECAANANQDQSHCPNSQVTLNAPISLFYNTPPNIKWSCISVDNGTILPGDVSITNPNDYVTDVSYNGAPLPPGIYTFRFCVDCKDLNNDGINDRPCDDVIVTIEEEPTAPVIIESDGSQDGMMTVCNSTTVQVNPPGDGEIASVDYFPNDGMITYNLSGTTLTLDYYDNPTSSRQERCDYTITYSIARGDCVRETSVDIKFISPHDPNGDGIIEGRILNCPSCTTSLRLLGDRPGGCYGIGTWTFEDGPAVALISNPSLEFGDAYATVSAPGTYTFKYTVTNIEPCEDSEFLITCDVLDVGGFDIGPDTEVLYCDNIIPAGTYTFSVNDLPNTIYSWPSTNDPNVIINGIHNSTITITFLTDYNLGAGQLNFCVNAWRYYQVDTCDGNGEPQVVELPYSTYEENIAHINSLQSDTCIVIYNCYDNACIRFKGSPVVEVETEDIQFLCSDGVETIRLSDYFNVVNLFQSSYSSSVTLVSKPPTAQVTGSLGINSFITLNGLCDYVFKIVLTSNQSGSNLTCSTTFYLNVRLRAPEPVTAGTDQVKCFNELIRLNGSTSFFGQNDCQSIQGTWTQVGCTSCTVTIGNVHDPNTEIFLTGISYSDLPITLCFVWSYDSQDASCQLSDTTKVIIKDCLTPCEDLGIYVEWECVDEEVILTAYYGNGVQINPADPYFLTWTLGSTTITEQNPITIPKPSGALPYTFEIYLPWGEIDTCHNEVTGVINCDGPPPPSGCDITILEKCDENGNVIIVAVDTDTGIPVPPTTYLHEFYWWVYSGPGDNVGTSIQDQNPIVVNPNACYRLLYERYYYPANAPYHVPGMQDSICRLEVPKTCVSISCPGPCSDFPEFFVAGCGDDLALSLGLPFPDGCHNVCSYGAASGTLGVFQMVNGVAQPVGPPYSILWEDGSTGPYATGYLLNINYVKVTGPVEGDTCFWEDTYKPSCICRSRPLAYCEQPIIKYCYPDGSVVYSPGPPQISWYGVSGASAYELEFTYDNSSGCCEVPPTLPPNITVNASPFVIPDSWN
ncbi:MAG: hypothetical protein KDC61_14325, partial [Saprospiraceae bacterium]|nr:hypothetical protein [Saprospiraceae bacterium]